MRLPLSLQQRLARALRVHALCAATKALYTLEINGEHASIKWDLHDLHRLRWFDHKGRGAPPRVAVDPRERRRPAPHEELVGARSPDRIRAQLRAPGGGLPSRDSNPARARPNFRDGLATDYVVDAVLASARTKKWTKVKQVKAAKA